MIQLIESETMNKKAVEMAKRLFQKGMSKEDIAEVSELPLATVERLIKEQNLV